MDEPIIAVELEKKGGGWTQVGKKISQKIPPYCDKEHPLLSV
jgi:hypothetical protein